MSVSDKIKLVKSTYFLKACHIVREK